MADTSNLTRFLTDVAKAIKDKKGSTDLIPAANFDTEIMNLPSGGLDTSDATATAEDIAQGKTAYVKDQKVEGTVWDARGTVDETFLAGPSEYEVDYENADNGNGGWVNVYSKFDNPVIMNEHSKVHTGVLGSFVANAVGLTPDKIATGNTILGVVGTASAGDGQMTQEEYDNAVITTEYILGWRQPEPEYHDESIMFNDSPVTQVTILSALKPVEFTLNHYWADVRGAGFTVLLNILPEFITEFHLYMNEADANMADAEVIGNTSYGAEIKRKQNEANQYVFSVWYAGVYVCIKNHSELFGTYGIADIENIVTNLIINANIPEYYDQTITLTGDSSIHQVTVLHDLQPKTDTLGLVWESDIGAGVAIELNTLPDLTEFNIYTDTTEVGMDGAEVIGSTSYGSEIKRKQNEAGVYVFGVYNAGMYFHVSNCSEVFNTYGVTDIENLVTHLTVTLETSDTGVTVNFTDSILESVTFGPAIQASESLLSSSSDSERCLISTMFEAFSYGAVDMIYTLESQIPEGAVGIDIVGYIGGDETTGIMVKRMINSYGYWQYYWEQGEVYISLVSIDDPDFEIALSDLEMIVLNTTIVVATPAQDISAFAQTLADLSKEEYDAYYMPYVYITTPILSSDTTALSTLVERMTNDIPALENDESIIFSFYDGDYRMAFNSSSWSRGFDITDPNDMLLLEFFSVSPSSEASVGEWYKYQYNPDTSESTYTNVTSIADTISFGTVYNKLASMQMTIPDRLRTQEYIYKILSLLETAFNCTIKYKPEE